MSERQSEFDSGADEAHKIAENTTAKDFFLNEQEKLIDDWADKAKKLFKYIQYYPVLQEKFSKVNTN